MSPTSEFQSMPLSRAHSSSSRTIIGSSDIMASDSGAGVEASDTRRCFDACVNTRCGSRATQGEKLAAGIAKTAHMTALRILE